MSLTASQIQLGNTFVAYHTQDANAGPYEWQGAAYQFGFRIVAATGLFDQGAVYRSTDGGLTWTQQDIANTPVVNNNGAFAIFYPKSGGSVIYVAWTSPPDAVTDSPIKLSSFDMSTNTWAVVATGGPNLNRSSRQLNPPLLLVRRSDGSFVVQFSGFDGANVQVYYTVFSGGVWSAAVLVSSGYAGGTAAYVSLMGITNSDVTLMLWYSDSGAGAGILYCNTLTGSTLSAHVQVYDIAGNGRIWLPDQWDTNGGWNCQGIFLSTLNKIIWGLAFGPSQSPANTLPTVLIADTSVSPPVFSLVTVGNTICQAQNWCVLGVNGAETQFTMAWNQVNSGTGLNQILTATAQNPSGPWGASSVFYDENATPPIPPPPVIEINSLSGRVLSGGLSLGVGLWSLQNGKNWFQAQFGIVQIAVVPTPPASSGGRAFITVKFNEYTACLARDWNLYRRIDRLLLSCGRKPECFCYDERQWGWESELVPTSGPPYGALDFNPAAQLALPAPGADTLILSFRVPTGYDGIILGHYHGFAGPGFAEGSGDLIWRLRADRRYLRDCGNMLVTMGSARQLSTVPGGLQLRSNDLVEYLVNAPNTSGNLGVGKVLAGVHGYYWPRL